MPDRKEKLMAAVLRLGGLRCPVCGAALLPAADGLRCGKNHCVNVSRRGTLNVLSAARTDAYDGALFAARRRVFAAGCYEAVANAVEALLPEGPQRLLDAGCGEGWYLNRLLSRHPGWCGAGVDISREAIRMAAGWPCEAVWCVADLKRLPFRDGCFTAVLDVLTPADYAEFRRVLAPGGRLIKVFPGGDYLRELREARGLPLYEAGTVADWLREHARVLETRQVRRTVPVSPEVWADFVRMTPLNQDLDSAALEDLCKKPAAAVTVDLTVAACSLKAPRPEPERAFGV